MADQFVIVLTTWPADAEQVGEIAKTLVNERLAACVNVYPPMTSYYRWQGAIHQDSERQVVIKTTRERVAALGQRLRELHPYDVPEFIVLPIVGGSDAYLRWIGESTSPGPA